MNKLLGTLVCLLFAVGAHAQTTLTLTGFTVQFDQTVPPTLSVLSDTGATARLGLPLIASHASLPDSGLYAEDLAELYLTPRPGYVIDSVSLTGTLTGSLYRDSAPAGAVNVIEPVVHNRARIALDLSSEAAQSVQDLSGTVPLDLHFQNLHANAPFVLDVADVLSEQTLYGSYELDGEEHRINAYAAIALIDPVLMIRLAAPPVPEPQTWTMLAFGLLALRMRRRSWATR